MGFLRRVAAVSLRDKVKSAVIPEGLEVEPLFLCVERNQLTWFRCLQVAPLTTAIKPICHWPFLHRDSASVLH